MKTKIIKNQTKLNPRIFYKLVLFTIILSVYQCKNPETGKELKAIAVTDANNKEYNGVIAGTNITFTDKVPYGTTEVNLKTLAISNKASADKKIGDKIGVGTSTLTVSAEDNSTQSYTLTLNVAEIDTDNDINAIVITAGSADFNGTISGTNITFDALPYGTTQVTLKTLSIPATATANMSVNDTLSISGETITVTAQNNSTKTYSLTMNILPASKEKSITAMVITVSGNDFTGTVSGTEVIFKGIPNAHEEAPITLKTLTLSAFATANKSEGNPLSLSGQTLTVTAQDTTTQTYTLSINLFAQRNTNKEFNIEVGDFNQYLGLWSDGTTLWISDNWNDKINAFNLSNKVREMSKDLTPLSGNNNLSGIWSDGTTLWVIDSADDKIYAYNLSTKVRIPSEDFNTLSGAGNNAPGGLWSDGTTLWVIDSADDKIYAYNLSTKVRIPNKDFNTLSGAGNQNATGLWSDGTTLWVSDASDDKIYAYNFNTQSREPNKDFTLLTDEGNNFPFGLWSDGNTIFVTDINRVKFYAYDYASE